MIAFAPPPWQIPFQVAFWAPRMWSPLSMPLEWGCMPLDLLLVVWWLVTLPIKQLSHYDPLRPTYNWAPVAQSQCIIESSKTTTRQGSSHFGNTGSDKLGWCLCLKGYQRGPGTDWWSDSFLLQFHPLLPYMKEQCSYSLFENEFHPLPMSVLLRHWTFRSWTTTL